MLDFALYYIRLDKNIWELGSRNIIFRIPIPILIPSKPVHTGTIREL
jgi:hypothetical protein